MIKQLATALALVRPALAQATSTWRDTEGTVHTEKQPPLDMEHAKGDPKYRPIIAVARVVSLRVNMVMTSECSIQE